MLDALFALGSRRLNPSATSVRKASASAGLSFMLALLALTPVLTATPALAADPDPTVTACLNAFGDHPFGSNPEFKTLPVAVKVFGVGKKTIDKEITSSPALVYVKQGVNVMGGTVVELRNPQGWYCMRAAVNVMGGFTVKLACGAHFAVLGEGASVMSGSDGENGTTVMGSTRVERDC